MTDFLEGILLILIFILIIAGWITIFIGAPMWILLKDMSILVYGFIVTFCSGGLAILITIFYTIICTIKGVDITWSISS